MLVTYKWLNLLLQLLLVQKHWKILDKLIQHLCIFKTKIRDIQMVFWDIQKQFWEIWEIFWAFPDRYHPWRPRGWLSGCCDIFGQKFISSLNETFAWKYPSPENIAFSWLAAPGSARMDRYWYLLSDFT